jgi:hypothetical protein
MPRGASKKREKEYEQLQEEFQESGRYKGREKEVASRIVNKQRAQFGETKGAKDEDRKGESPDRDMPIKDYDHLTVDQVLKKIVSLSSKDVQRIKAYEQKHKKRKSLLEKIDRK